MVVMSDDSLKYIRDIVFGDIVKTDDGNATIEGIIRRVLEVENVYLSNGVPISLKHPVFIDGEWKYPPLSEARASTSFQTDFILNEGKSHFYVKISPERESIKCVSLAHGLEINVPDNNYFKSQQCREDFQVLYNENKKCSFNESQWVRNDQGVITGVDVNKTVVNDVI
jgi:hypothetical protein